MPSTFYYISPLWRESKKSKDNENKWRIVTDYRNLNSFTADHILPMPNIESLFDKVGRANYFSKWDLDKWFRQILMDENDIEKTMFSTPRGHFEFIQMPFGLKNAPATFQRMMNFIFRDFINKFCVIYIDKVLVFQYH